MVKINTTNLRLLASVPDTSAGWSLSHTALKRRRRRDQLLSNQAQDGCMARGYDLSVMSAQFYQFTLNYCQNAT